MDNDEDATTVLITSNPSLFYYLDTLTVLHRYSCALHMTKKVDEERMYFFE
jgi:hypothetical protein